MVYSFISGLPLLHTIISISDRELGLFGFYQRLFLVRFLDEKGPDNFYIIDLLFYCYFTPSPEHIPRNFPKPLSHPFSFFSSFLLFLSVLLLVIPTQFLLKTQKMKRIPFKNYSCGYTSGVTVFYLMLYMFFFDMRLSHVFYLFEVEGNHWCALHKSC